jgi:hypothetical protein
MVKADLTRDYYGDLELPPTADVAEIKKQFKKLGMYSVRPCSIRPLFFMRPISIHRMLEYLLFLIRRMSGCFSFFMRLISICRMSECFFSLMCLMSLRRMSSPFEMLTSCVVLLNVFTFEDKQLLYRPFFIYVPCRTVGSFHLWGWAACPISSPLIKRLTLSCSACIPSR